MDQCLVGPNGHHAWRAYEGGMEDLNLYDGSMLKISHGNVLEVLMVQTPPNPSAQQFPVTVQQELHNGGPTQPPRPELCPLFTSPAAALRHQYLPREDGVQGTLPGYPHRSNTPPGSTRTGSPAGLASNLCRYPAPEMAVTSV